MAATMNKRKRDDHDMPHMRAAPGMHAAPTDFNDQYLHTDDTGLEHDDAAMSNFADMLAQHATNSVGHVIGEVEEDDLVPRPQVPSGGPPPSASDTAAAAMAQYHTMTIPQSTEQTFMQQGHDGTQERQNSESGEPASAPQRTSSFGDLDASGTRDAQQSPEGDTSPTGAGLSGLGLGLGGSKPAVGSDEWHKVRRDNHKEVERRRRETINEGINELAKIVPGCEKNKGSILARAVQFITQLKENESQNIEKWTLEKLLTEQAIAELSSSCDKMKAECQRAWAECEQWKRAAQKAGLGAEGKEDAEGEEEG